MSDIFRTLLDATIDHLEQMKTAGTQFVPVNADTLEALRQMPREPVRPVRDSPTPTAANMRATEGPAADRLAEPRLASAPPPAPSAPIRPLAASPPPDVKPPAPLAAQAPAEFKAQAMAELRQRALVCVKCPNLAAARTQVVFGVGDINASLMFVGEAPGADEDQQGEPFVGAAGQLLTRIIQTMGLSRETVYIANILKCRPDTPGQAHGNRKPTPGEMKTCLPYLEAQIDLIQPKVLVALGATAVEGLLGKTVGITRLRGHWQTYRGIPLMPTYHPAYLLRNQARSERRNVWEDMLQVLEKLGLPITEKQRAYFS